MYSRPRFLEELHAIREEMSRECDYDMDLFTEMIRSKQRPQRSHLQTNRGLQTASPTFTPPPNQQNKQKN